VALRFSIRLRFVELGWNTALARGGVADRFLCFITVSGMCSLKLNFTFEKVSVLRFSLKMLDLSLS
jgi:hypothetical protein